MNIFDVTSTKLIETISIPSDEDFHNRFVATRTPVILDCVEQQLDFVRKWSFDYFAKRLKTVRVQRPSSDGIYHYLGFERIPFSEFADNLINEKNMYALEPLIGHGAPQGSQADGLGSFQRLEVYARLPLLRLDRFL